ncbi:MAG: DCC1-like thiol-disulfide oxidoreductase family protein [bacterium]
MRRGARIGRHGRHLMDQPALLLWDGACGFCRRCADWVERRSGMHPRPPLQGRHFVASPFQEAPSPPMTDALRLRCARAVHLILPDGTTLSAGRACLGVLSLLGWPRTARLLSLPPLVWIVEALYRLVAMNRGWLGRIG